MFLLAHYICSVVVVVVVWVHACCIQGWGVTVTLGVPKVKPEVAAHYALFLSGRTLKGSLFGGWKPKSDIPSLVDMYLNKVRVILF